MIIIKDIDVPSDIHSVDIYWWDKNIDIKRHDTLLGTSKIISVPDDVRHALRSLLIILESGDD